MALKKPDGQDYEPGSIVSYYGCVKRKLAQEGYKPNLGEDSVFTLSRKVLSSKKKSLKKSGKGNLPNRAECVGTEIELKLWESQQFSIENPEGLQNFVWYSFTKGFGFRGCQESKQLLWGDIKLIESEDSKHIEFNEKTTKTRNGDTSHNRNFIPKIFESSETETSKCPVHAYQVFASHRPESMLSPEAPFFLTPIKKPRTDVWFKCAPMGVNQLNSIMKRMCSNANITGKFTNHSVRRTTCNTLLNAGIHPNDVSQLTGHKNTASLNSYAVSSTQKQREMSLILQNPNSCANSSNSSIGPVEALTSPPTRAAPVMDFRAHQQFTSTTVNQPQSDCLGGIFYNCNMSFNGNVTFNVK